MSWAQLFANPARPKGPKLYPLGDRVTPADRIVAARGELIQAVYADEKRPPRKGEWYLSGAKVTAYRAAADLQDVRPIARLVRTVSVQRWEIVES